MLQAFFIGVDFPPHRVWHIHCYVRLDVTATGNFVNNK
jgi:hypothetical protein